MIEEVLVTARANPKVDPVLGIWSWEIPVYLFLGGLTAGIMLLAALMILMRKGEQAPFVARRFALWAPVVLSIGMGALFLDLERKLHVFRFYTTVQWTSPMSWGSWVLVLVYPASILLALATLRAGYPALAAWVDRFPPGRWLTDLCERHDRAIAAWNLPLALALGIYTGILLSAFGARPFWNTGILGPLFLVSGLSSAAALAALSAQLHGERHLFARIDVGLILAEILIIGLLVINLATGSKVQLQAAGLILGGSYTLSFWVYFFAAGLVAPLLIELAAPRRVRSLAILAPVLVLCGGYLLRQLTVELGQLSTWTDYATLYDPALLERLH